jgi:hypothetical protein
MSVSSVNPAIEIRDNGDDDDDGDGAVSLKHIALNDADKKYVLAKDIALGAGWSPVGTGSGAEAFTGKFYGNGHTITVNGNPLNKAYTGIFGYAEATEIRDLRVHYAADTSAGASATNIGGLAGYAGGGTAVRNVLVTGGGALKYNGGGTPYIGGLLGRLEGTSAAPSSIENCYGGLSLDVTGSDPRAGALRGIF